MMPLLSIGFTHRTSDIAFRERLTPDGDQLAHWNEEVAGVAPHSVVLRTCGRFETFIDPGHADRTRAALLSLVRPLLEWLARRAGMATDEVALHGRILTGHRVASHLYRVAAGLDSAIPGEDHILGQVGRAFESAEARGAPGPILSAVFRGAVRAGRLVRSQTSIQKVGSSFSIVAIERLAQARAQGAARLLIVGSGTLASEIAVGTAGMKWDDVAVVGRHIDRARVVADLAAGRAVAFDQLPMELSAADVVVACTSSTTFTIRAEMLGCLDAADRGNARRRLLLDLGLPRNVDPEAARCTGVELLDLDQLAGGRRAKDGLAEAMGQAERVLAGELRRLRRWLIARKQHAASSKRQASAPRNTLDAHTRRSTTDLILAGREAVT